MKRAFAATILVLLVAGCGAPAYQKLTLHRTGGIAGFDEIYSVRKDGIGRIEDNRNEVTRTVKLDKDALGRIARVLERVPEDTPEFLLNQGFDLMTYELTLEPEKGDPRTYRWDDGVRAQEAKQETTLAALQDLSRVIIEQVKKAAQR